MEKDRGFRVMAIIAILVSIVGLTVGFAALDQRLEINTAATLKGSQWTVKFDNLGTPTETGTATGTAVLNDLTTVLNVTANLKKPGDKVVYTFDVINDGDIDAKLSAVPVFSGDAQAATDAHINYTLTYSDGSSLSANDPLDAEQVRHLVLTVEFDSGATSVVASDTTFDLTVALLYIQN